MLPFVLVFRSQSVLKRNYFTSIFHYAFFSFFPAYDVSRCDSYFHIYYISESSLFQSEYIRILLPFYFRFYYNYRGECLAHIVPISCRFITITRDVCMCIYVQRFNQIDNIRPLFTTTISRSVSKFKLFLIGTRLQQRYEIDREHYPPWLILE